jgi:hypothetical protein
MRRWQEWSVLDAYKLALGVFLLLAPWLLGFSYRPARFDTWAIGILLVIASIAALMAFAKWEEWVMVLLGLWLVASPWMLAFPRAGATKIDIAVGLLVAYLAALELWLVRYEFPKNMSL